MKTGAGLLTTVVSLSLLTGCGAFPWSPREKSITSIVPDTPRVSAFVAVTDQGCPVTGKVGPAAGEEPAVAPVVGVLIGALAPIAADFVVGLVSAELERAQNDLNGQWVATGPVELVDGSCLVIVRGPLGDSKNYTDHEGSKIEKAKAETLGLAGSPAFYLEAAITQDGAQKGRFVFQTRFVEYANTAAVNPGNGEKEVAIVLALRQTPLATDASEESIKEGADAVIPLSLGRLEVGHSFGEGAQRYRDQARVISLTNSKGEPVTGKVNAVALVSESEDPNVALKVLAKAFEDNKDGLKEAIIDIVNSAAGSSDEKQK